MSRYKLVNTRSTSFSVRVLLLKYLNFNNTYKLDISELDQWKNIDCKQSARWQQLSQLKASAFFSLQKN
jgi:hypothetical protein